MITNSRAECLPHLARLREFTASGLKNILDYAEEMKTWTDALPDDLKPFGQVLTEMSLQALTESYLESLRLYWEWDLQQITQAAAASDVQPSSDVAAVPPDHNN